MIFPVVIALILIWAFTSMVPTRSMETLNRVRSNYSLQASYAGLRFGVDANLILAVIVQESNGNPGAVGKSGEHGLMQIMPGTWTDTVRAYSLPYSWTDSFDSTANILVGTAYLKSCLLAFGGNIQSALQAYNGGISGVKSNPRKSLAYAQSVLSLYNTYSA